MGIFLKSFCVSSHFMYGLVWDVIGYFYSKLWSLIETVYKRVFITLFYVNTSQLLGNVMFNAKVCTSLRLNIRFSKLFYKQFI
jgi:hypothetical protein